MRPRTVPNESTLSLRLAGPITGEANVTQLGKTIAFVAARLTSDNGTVLATATTSARLVETAKAIRQDALDRAGP